MGARRMGNWEGGGGRYGRDRKGERQRGSTLCCILSPWLRVSLPLPPKVFLPSFARCFATGKKVLREHGVLILPGSLPVVEKKKKLQKIKSERIPQTKILTKQ